MGDQVEGPDVPLASPEVESDPDHVAREPVEVEPGETHPEAVERQAIEHAAAAATTVGPGVARFSFKRFHNVYRIHMPHNPRKERLFLGTLGFLIAIVLVRLLTYSIKAGISPVHNVNAGGTHVHHLVWGILLLILVGYLWMVEIGTRDNKSNWMSRLTSIAFGIGVALTLDEFALWLNLEDVYWDLDGKGQQSVWVVMVFGGLLAFGFLGGAFIRGLVREMHAMARGIQVAEHMAAIEMHAASQLAEREFHAVEGAAEKEFQHMRHQDEGPAETGP